jgi:HlyD family secretion protein
VRRRPPTALIIAVSVIAGIAAVAVIARAGLFGIAADDKHVPVFEVKSGKFSRTISAEGYLRPVKASPLTAPDSGRSTLIGWMVEDGAAVKKGEVVIRFDSNDAVRALADGKDDQTAAETRIEKERLAVNSAVAERSRAAALTKEEMNRARELGKKDPRFFPRTEVIESEIDEALLGERLRQTQNAGQVEKQLGKSRVALLAVDRQKVEMQLAEANRTLKALEVRAPHDGVFVIQRWGWTQRVLQSGDRAYPGMRIAEVATSDRMDAEISVLEADAGGLASGKRALLVLDARPDVTWKGKVKKVDPFPKAKHPEVPAQYFGAILSMEGDTSKLKPGQRLRATLILDELPQALVIPRQAVFQKDEGSFVHRRAGWRGGFVPVPVTLGPGTVGRVVVVKGLDAGDVVALRDPSKSADEAVAPAPGQRPSVGRAPPESGGGRGRRGDR